MAQVGPLYMHVSSPVVDECGIWINASCGGAYAGWMMRHTSAEGLKDFDETKPSWHVERSDVCAVPCVLSACTHVHTCATVCLRDIGILAVQGAVHGCYCNWFTCH